MVKSYTVVMGNEVLFGPETDYAKVKGFVDTLNPAIKSKCSVKVAQTTSGNQPGEVVKEAKEEALIDPAGEPVKKSTKSAAPDVNSVFGAYLEGGGQSAFWKPKDGRNIVRILPIGGVLPTDWVTPYPFLLSGVHSNVGLSLRDTIYCARLTHNKACPICNFVWKLYNTKDNNDLELAKRIKAYNRVIANIIDLSDVEKGVQKFAFGKTLARKIMSYMEDPDFAPLLDAEAGHNFIVIKKTVDGFPNYDDSRPEVKTTSLTAIYGDWKKEAYDLKKEIVEKSYDELMAILTDTKKAILSTSPDEIRAGASARPAQHTDKAGEETTVTEVSVDALKDRLESI